MDQPQKQVTEQTEEVDIEPTDEAWEYIKGAYDLQLHVAPDVMPRRIDDIDVAHEFLERGLSGFVLKSHYFMTAERAAVVTKAVPGIKAYGAVTLNHSMGGLNPVAVDLAGRAGARLVWMPTVDALNETAGRSPDAMHPPFWATFQRELSEKGISPDPITVLNEEGEISASAKQCLEIIAEHNMVLCTGHLGRKEIFPLVDEAKKLGVQKIVVTHAEFPSQNFSQGEQYELAARGAIIEHCFTTTHTNKAPWQLLFANVAAVGPERVILSSDLGQPSNPPVSLGLAIYAQRFLDAGFSAANIQSMFVQNPAQLVEH